MTRFLFSICLSTRQRFALAVSVRLKRFVVTRLSRGVRVEVTKDGVVIVPDTYGLCLSQPPGAEDVQIDKFNILLQHRRRGHGTEIMRRLAKWFSFRLSIVIAHLYLQPILFRFTLKLCVF